MKDSRLSLREYVSASRLAQPPLPLMHTTDGFSFKKILKSSALSPVRCPLFRERLLYLFYGCPAYRPNPHSLPTSVPGYLPVCLIFAPKCASIKRIYPFDSGAFSKGLYRRHLPSRVARARFELERSPDTPGRFVHAFYGTNENYYDGTPVITRSFSALKNEVRCYRKLICDKRPSRADLRRGIAEVQTSDALPLACGTMLAVALPLVLLDDRLVRQRLKALDVRKLIYRAYCLEPMLFVTSILDLVRTFLKERNYL